MKEIQIVLLLLLLAVSASASGIDEVMDKANHHYRNGDFNSAIEQYEKLISEGYQGASLFYNLGNSYYRTGKLGYAILYYEKALKLSPNDEDIKHNLALANSRTIDKLDTLPKFFLFEWWESFLAFFSTQTWIILTLIVYLIFLILVAFYFFAGQIINPRVSFFSSTVILFFLILLVSVVAVKLNRESKRIEAVIIENSIVVKLSPDKQGKDGFVIHEGSKILLEEQIDEWKKIRLPDGKVGWVKENQIAVI